MTSNRSFLDNLNSGRRRRARTSIEDLNRSLGDLETRFGNLRGDEESDENDRRSRRLADDWRPQAGQPADRTDGPAFAAPERSPAAPESPIAAIRRDLERSRRQSASHTAGDMSADMKALREDIRQQMTAGMRREFDSLRKDIEHTYRNSGSDGRELSAELERLSNTLHLMAERSDDRGLDMLRGELEQVRHTLAELAREETVRSMDERWSRIEQNSFARTDKDPAIAMLRERLEQIGEAVGNLPDSRALRSLEEKVRSLSTSMDQFSHRNPATPDDTFETIFGRLDEISRAIASSPRQAQALQSEPFERIEARISALAQQLEDLSTGAPSAEIVERLNDLTRQVEEVAYRASLPEQGIERLGRQMATITERLEAGASHDQRDQVLDSLERRFAEIASLFEERHEKATSQGQALFKDMERRIGELATRLESRQDAGLGMDPALLEALDEKFADLSEQIGTRREPGIDPNVLKDFERRLASMADKLDATFKNAADLDPSLLHALDEKFADLSERIDAGRIPAAVPQVMQSLEQRVEAIARKLEENATRPSDTDPNMIANLERQITGLAEFLSKPAPQQREPEVIAPRLESIERSLADQRDAIIAAAQEAAENAVRSMHDGGMNDEDVTALASEMKTLEILARKSDERNARTFEAIHDTLLKVVDRLGSMEARNAELASASRSRLPADSIPPIAPRSAEMPMPAAAAVTAPKPQPQPHPKQNGPIRVGRSPAEAAAEAALAAGEVEQSEQPEATRKSVLGGLARAFKGKKEPGKDLKAGREPVMPGIDDIGLDEPLDEPNADKPLEPGSGAPDLNAIMKRVRDERSSASPQRGDPNAAKADFIAAARRAAQAAAAEAQSIKQGGSPDGSKGKLSPSELFRARRKPILMAAAAIMIALAGLQLGKAFFSDPVEVADVEVLPSSQGTIVASAPAVLPNDAAQADAKVRVVGEDANPISSATADAEPVQEETEVAGLQEERGGDTTAAIAENGGTSSDEQVAALPDAEPDVAVTEEDMSFEPAPVEAGPVALREAADSGNPVAMFEIGNRYDVGRGVDADRAVAAEWYERSAELGFAPAQYRIGSFYEKDIGVDRDIAQAKTWYQLAANQGNASAMHNLAVLHAMGSDGAVDNDSAARWFQKAAELGVKDSQYNLGILAAKGLGVPQSLEESYKWFALVAKTGDKDAATKRDEVANALRPEQLAKARAATELWKPKPLVEDANVVEIPELLAGERRHDGRYRHEEGGPEHPAHSQQERLQGGLRRRHHGPEHPQRDHRLPERQRAGNDRRSRRKAGQAAAGQEIEPPEPLWRRPVSHFRPQAASWDFDSAPMSAQEPLKHPYVNAFRVGVLVSGKMVGLVAWVFISPSLRCQSISSFCSRWARRSDSFRVSSGSAAAFSSRRF